MSFRGGVHPHRPLSHREVCFGSVPSTGHREGGTDAQRARWRHGGGTWGRPLPGEVLPGREPWKEKYAAQAAGNVMKTRTLRRPVLPWIFLLRGGDCYTAQAA